MKTETNLYLRSLVGEKKAALCEAHDEDLRKLNDALTELRTEATQKQPCSTVPPLSEKTVEAIRHLLEINLKSANDASDWVNRILLLMIPAGEKLDNIVLNAKTKIDEATTALREFNAAYPVKPSK